MDLLLELLLVLLLLLLLYLILSYLALRNSLEENWLCRLRHRREANDVGRSQQEIDTQGRGKRAPKHDGTYPRAPTG